MKKPLSLLLCLLLHPAASLAFMPIANSASSLLLATPAAAARIISTQAPSALVAPSSPLFQSKRRRPLAASTLPQERQLRRGRQGDEWEQGEDEQDGTQETEKRERKPILSTLVEVLASKLLRKTARRVSGLDIDVGARSNSDVLAGNLPLVKVCETCVCVGGVAGITVIVIVGRSERGVILVVFVKATS